ncbi:putative damage-inducible protein DinB [Geomicrobium halophilum]|uniref:Putative damage-inducible protein DinB n=1 Tax=Geomicrobium halophilum TaxID=549000 RepID=A0A841Q0R4_9BACL|nr:DinB family protein [Geomicrobium halophilum]MBB6451413.1 putative damage-inducible protein DinB [Geomicrobium halophilum]
MFDPRFHSKEGYDQGVGELVYMLELTRTMTEFELQDLTQENLDYLIGESSNSIGMLLSHIASIEYVHQVMSFEDRMLNKQEQEEWTGALKMGEKGRTTIKGNDLDYYLKKLADVREKTYGFLKNQDDQWLYQERKFPDGTPYNNYYLWFHVIEDEISHRGQIKLIKRLIQEGN